jgi:hypothetical protein
MKAVVAEGFCSFRAAAARLRLLLLTAYRHQAMLDASHASSRTVPACAQRSCRHVAVFGSIGWGGSSSQPHQPRQVAAARRRLIGGGHLHDLCVGEGEGVELPILQPTHQALLVGAYRQAPAAVPRQQCGSASRAWPICGVCHMCVAGCACRGVTGCLLLLMQAAAAQH